MTLSFGLKGVWGMGSMEALFRSGVRTLRGPLAVNEVQAREVAILGPSPDVRRDMRGVPLDRPTVPTGNSFISQIVWQDGLGQPRWRTHKHREGERFKPTILLEKTGNDPRQYWQDEFDFFDKLSKSGAVLRLEHATRNAQTMIDYANKADAQWFLDNREHPNVLNIAVQRLYAEISRLP